MTTPAGSITGANVATELGVALNTLDSFDANVHSLAGIPGYPITSGSLRNKSALVANRQVSATLVDVNGYDTIAYPTSTVKTLEGTGALTPGTFAYGNMAPGNIHFYYDFGAPKLIGSYRIFGWSVQEYGTGNWGRSVYAGVWCSNDGASWVLIGAHLSSDGTFVSDTGQVALNQTWRYIALGVYSWYVYDGFFGLDYFGITAAP